MLALEAVCASLTDSHTKLQARDLESCIHHNNIRVVSVPESVEGPRPTVFFTEPLAEVFGNDILPSPPELCRAHRALRAEPNPGERPRAVIIRLHRYQQKERIVREARAMRGKLQF